MHRSADSTPAGVSGSTVWEDGLSLSFLFWCLSVIRSGSGECSSGFGTTSRLYSSLAMQENPSIWHRSPVVVGVLSFKTFTGATSMGSNV